MRRIHVALVFLVLIASGGPARPQSSEALDAAIARIHAMAAAEQAKDGLGSVTVGVVSGRRLIWAKSYGLADMETGAVATPETVYRIGSITKVFTGVMLLQLAQDGRVRPGDAVQTYLPEISRIQNQPARAVTLEQLATMTSGLAREPANVATYDVGPVSEWQNVLLAALPHTRFESSPGTRYRYSNIGYAVLGAALSRAAGMSYVDYVQQRILAPLGMKDTAFEPNDRIRPRVAKGYNVDAAGEIQTEAALKGHEGRGYRVPNGALYSTVSDLANLVAFELGEGPDAVLPKRVVDGTLEKLAWDSARKDSAYGVGMQYRQMGRFVAFGHDGDVPGYLANVRFNRANKTGVIVLRNVNGGRFDMRGFTYAALTELSR